MTQETFKVAVELALQRLRSACGLEHMGVYTWRERVVRASSKTPFRPQLMTASTLSLAGGSHTSWFRLAYALAARDRPPACPESTSRWWPTRL
jgi:hypothetical protein